MKVIIATVATRFAGQGRKSPRGRNAETTLPLIDAMQPFGESEPGRTIKGVE